MKKRMSVPLLVESTGPVDLAVTQKQPDSLVVVIALITIAKYL